MFETDYIMSNKIDMFCILLHILCMPWLPDVYDRFDFQVVLHAILKLCIWMDLYGNWWVGLDSAVNYADRVWKRICWLNGLRSSRVQGIIWASNHCAAVRYAAEYFFHWVQQENLSGETIFVAFTAYLAAAWWFKLIWYLGPLMT